MLTLNELAGCQESRPRHLELNTPGPLPFTEPGVLGLARRDLCPEISHKVLHLLCEWWHPQSPALGLWKEPAQFWARPGTSTLLQPPGIHPGSGRAAAAWPRLLNLPRLPGDGHGTCMQPRAALGAMHRASLAGENPNGKSPPMASTIRAPTGDGRGELRGEPLCRSARPRRTRPASASPRVGQDKILQRWS